MLDIVGANNRFCDRVTRRDCLRVGALGVGGLTLPGLLGARAAAAPKRTPKSVIMVCLCGGPSHIDMYDMKPNAPAECRGEFRPIKTNVPGFDVCELMPLQAQIADKLAVVRGVQFHDIMSHSAAELFTGFTIKEERPALGSVVSMVRPRRGTLPAYVSLEKKFTNPFEHPRYLGAAHAPLFHGDGLNALQLPREVPLDRLSGRKELLSTLDGFRKAAERQQQRGLDPLTARALDIVSSPQTRDAFDLSREAEKTRARYGPAGARFGYVRADDMVWPGEKFLLARRLVEAGVPVVTLCIGSGMSGWDHHGKVGGFALDIFSALRSVLPHLDRSVHALVTDLHERGLSEDVAVVVWGEFGRTPHITPVAGRDHWIDAGFALLAGGGLKMGQVVGQTDARGAQPRGAGFHAQNVVATLYHLLGVNPQLMLQDQQGRPLPLLDHAEPIAALV